MGTFSDVSPLSDHNSRFEHVRLPTAVVESMKNDQSLISVVESCMFNISLPQSSRSTIIDDDETTYIPVYTQRKARPAPSTTWKAPISIPKSSTMIKQSNESLVPTPELLPPSKFLCLHIL
jgi:hypothetical protein